MKNQAAVNLGRKGGKKKLEKYGPEVFREMSKKAAEKRKKKKTDK